MMINLLEKILLFLVSAIPLLFGGFFVAIMFALSGSERFYPPFILICTGIIILFVFLLVFKLVKPAKLKVLALAFLGIAILSVGVFELNRSYHNRFAQLKEHEVNLEEYKPFSENTKAVALEEQSTLKLDDDLPRLDGATALYPLYSAFVQAVYPEQDYSLYAMKEENAVDQGEVICTTTSTAYTRLINGETDIIFVASPSAEQLADAQREGVELKLTPIGKEAFVFFVNAKSSVDNLTTTQIQDIYSGNISNWKEVGGNNQKIKAFQRRSNSGSQTMLQKIMAGKPLITPPKEDVVTGMGGIIAQTANYRNYKNAIGFSFLFFATEMVQNNQIKLLAIDDVAPNKDTIANGAYPFAAEFYAVTANSDNPNVRRFIEWILSPQGQYLIEKTGYTPLNR